MASTFKPPYQEVKKWTAEAREALQLLGISVIEARALKNRLHCQTISEFVTSLHESKTQRREQNFTSLVYESLLNKQKTNSFVQTIGAILTHQEKMSTHTSFLQHVSNETKSTKNVKINEVVADKMRDYR